MLRNLLVYIGLLSMRECFYGYFALEFASLLSWPIILCEGQNTEVLTMFVLLYVIACDVMLGMQYCIVFYKITACECEVYSAAQNIVSQLIFSFDEITTVNADLLNICWFCVL